MHDVHIAELCVCLQGFTSVCGLYTAVHFYMCMSCRYLGVGTTVCAHESVYTDVLALCVNVYVLVKIFESCKCGEGM